MVAASLHAWVWYARQEPGWKTASPVLKPVAPHCWDANETKRTPGDGSTDGGRVAGEKILSNRDIECLSPKKQIDHTIMQSGHPASAELLNGWTRQGLGTEQML